MSALVIDSSFAIAALAGIQDEHEWAERQAGVHDLIAPEHLPVEVEDTGTGGLTEALRMAARSARSSSR